ncbi:thiamine pyrophosphate-binding protein [Propylenella binzhouense]|nr:thiamine pyrophosphate-binding protein [Propylenella binzhouense]
MTDIAETEHSHHVAASNNAPEYGSDLMVQLLRDLGAEYIFLNPGSSYRGIHDSLVNFLGNRAPEIVLVTHEMIAVAMAHGYAKATGKAGFCILHNLVGLMNGSMSVFNAFCDQTPILILGGSGPADPAERRFIDWAHSANTQGDLVRPYVKWTDEPATLDAALDSMLRAYRKAVTPPYGPAYVSIDAGLQEQAIASAAMPDPKLPRYQAPPKIHPDPAMIDKVADALLGARMPLVIGGRFGIQPAVTAPLVRLVELAGAAYVDDRTIVCFPSEHPQNMSGDRKIRGEADLFVCFDCQDLTAATGGYGSTRSGIMGMGAGAKEAAVVDVSLGDYFGNSWTRFGGPTPPADMQVIADPLLALEHLVAAVERKLAAGAPAALSARRAAIAERHADLAARRKQKLEARFAETPVSLERITHEVYQAVKDEDWTLVVRNHRTWVEGCWPFAGAGQYLGGDGGGGVGYGPGAAAGAALALKGTGKLPVAMIGDGDFMMAPGAIWSAAHHRVPLLMVILNNRSWGNDELHQREVAEHRGRAVANAHIGQRTYDPDADLAGVARSFGAWAKGPIFDPAEIAGALREAITEVKAGRVAVVEVVTALT